MAKPVFSPDDATGKEDRQGSHGASTRRPSLLDVAEGMGLRPDEKVRFARDRPEIAMVCNKNTEQLIGRPAPLHGGVRK